MVTQSSVDFLAKIDHRIDQLSRQPNMGVSSSKVKGVRGLLITRHNRLYYKINEDKVIILNLYDTRIKSNKNPFNK